MQFPDVVDAWFPFGNQFLNASSSQSLTVPALPAGQPAKGAVYVAILTAQAQAQWIRTDGVAVAAAVTGGIKMNPGDWRLIYGYEGISKVRVIRDADGGSLAAEYFYFRPTMI
jgi:hypothetical protein